MHTYSIIQRDKTLPKSIIIIFRIYLNHTIPFLTATPSYCTLDKINDIHNMYCKMKENTYISVYTRFDLGQVHSSDDNSTNMFPWHSHTVDYIHVHQTCIHQNLQNYVHIDENLSLQNICFLCPNFCQKEQELNFKRSVAFGDPTLRAPPMALMSLASIWTSHNSSFLNSRWLLEFLCS